ncbi:MAG: error-prone DNA polymerase, partial [Gemmatimonadetes bacterium]|nr:error-prone DNA polymerase [Gemmatimonadota bacterium]
PALRLGLRQIRGLKEEDADRLTALRGDGYCSPLDLRERTGIPTAVLTRLASADAFNSMGLDRRQAAWAVRAISETGPLPLFESAKNVRVASDQTAEIRPEPALPTMSTGEQVATDYRTMGLSLKQHPVALLRGRLKERGVLPAKDLERLSDGDRTIVAGIVLTRQRPGKGIVMFVTLEDETGTANLVVFPSIYENQRRDTLTSRLMMCRGKVQKVDGVIHVIAERITSLNDWLAELGAPGSDRGVAGLPGDGSGAVRSDGSDASFVARGRFFH